MNAQQIVNKLINEEMDGTNAPDKRRILRDERMNLQSVMQSGDAARIAAQKDEAERVMKMWEKY